MTDRNSWHTAAAYSVRSTPSNNAAPISNSSAVVSSAPSMRSSTSTAAFATPSSAGSSSLHSAPSQSSSNNAHSGAASVGQAFFAASAASAAAIQSRYSAGVVASAAPVRIQPMKSASTVNMSSTTGISASTARSSSLNSGVSSAVPTLPAPLTAEHQRTVRFAGGEMWYDRTLDDWDPNDFRIFVTDLGKEVTDDMLYQTFKRYPSLQRARVVKDKATGRTRGYGFVSLKDPQEYIAAMREMEGAYCGQRPMRLKKANWKERNVDIKEAKKRLAELPVPISKKRK